jgi:hypothetical protein
LKELWRRKSERQLREHLAGRRKTFDPKLDLAGRRMRRERARVRGNLGNSEQSAKSDTASALP